MNSNITGSVSAITIFLQGLLSFFSPCVLPLIPVYFGYLSGGTLKTGEDGTVYYDRKKVLINTLFFVIGIGFAFFLLGLGLRTVGKFFSGNQLLFARIGGIIVILFGLYQLGVFGDSFFLSKERRIPMKFNKMAMSPFMALLMGFVFSFAWTPCIGPALSGVLLMAASAQGSAAGFALIGVYTAGFAIPFLITGIFTASLLSLFKKHKKVVRYTTKIGGVLLIIMGIIMVTGQMNNISGYFSRLAGYETVTQEQNTDPDNTDAAAGTDSDVGSTDTESASTTDSEDSMAAHDFTLTDQNGVAHTLSDYKGKIVFLNFWATWCPPCRAEMPYIQAIYEENFATENSDLVILSVAFPNRNGEEDITGIKAFLNENGYTYPVLMDTGGELISPYGISAFPTTFMIDKDGNVFGYVPGGMSKEMMESIISQTRTGVTD